MGLETSWAKMRPIGLKPLCYCLKRDKTLSIALAICQSAIAKRIKILRAIAFFGKNLQLFQRECLSLSSLLEEIINALICLSYR
jgi:hypothetical protein